MNYQNSLILSIKTRNNKLERIKKSTFCAKICFLMNNDIIFAFNNTCHASNPDVNRGSAPGQVFDFYTVYFLPLMNTSYIFV